MACRRMRSRASDTWAAASLNLAYGPRTTCYSRFVRWRQVGIWDGTMDVPAADDDAAVQMIDTPSCACTSTESASRRTITKIWVAHQGA